MWTCLACSLVNSVDIVLSALSLSYNWCGDYSCLFVSLFISYVRVACFEFVCFLVLGFTDLFDLVVIVYVVLF